MTKRVPKKEQEEKIIKFLCGECDDEAELREVHRELCESDECYEFLLSTGRIMREIKECEQDKGEPVDWDELRDRFNRLSKLLEEQASAPKAHGRSRGTARRGASCEQPKPKAAKPETRSSKPAAEKTAKSSSGEPTGGSRGG